MVKAERKYKMPSLRYPGGKARVAKKIVAEMPPHKVYVEPFAGASHIFFEKPKAEKNVLNDKNKELIEFFKATKVKRLCCNIKNTSERLHELKNKKRTPCEFYETNRISYGGAGVFGAGYGHKKVPNQVCIDGAKLRDVSLTSEDFRGTIKKHDSKDTLFYIDPPYVKANQKSCLYGKMFCEVTPQEVAESIKNIKGKAIVSYDDHPNVRKAFKGFNFKTITLPYSLAKINGKVKGKTDEVLIKNY